jgi:hypothetical protein
VKCDTRPPRGAWAPGNYMRACLQCLQSYAGDKFSSRCADCAYANYVPEPVKLPHVKAHERVCKAIGDMDRESQAMRERIKQLDDAAKVAAEQIKLMAELHSKRTLDEAKRVLELEEAIRKTLDENRGLADGDDCTLHILKKALPTWN